MRSCIPQPPVNLLPCKLPAETRIAKLEMGHKVERPSGSAGPNVRCWQRERFHDTSVRAQLQFYKCFSIQEKKWPQGAPVIGRVFSCPCLCPDWERLFISLIQPSSSMLSGLPWCNPPLGANTRRDAVEVPCTCSLLLVSRAWLLGCLPLTNVHSTFCATLHRLQSEQGCGYGLCRSHSDQLQALTYRLYNRGHWRPGGFDSIADMDGFLPNGGGVSHSRAEYSVPTQGSRTLNRESGEQGWAEIAQ
jgi:hypothetical protein